MTGSEHTTLLLRVVAPMVALGLLLLTGCASEEGIAQTAAALEELEDELLARDDVTWASASYDRSTGVDDPTVISIMGRAIVADEGELRALADTFLRAAWRSDIPTIVRVSVELRSEEDREVTYSEMVVPRDELEERFGARDDG